MSGFWNIFVWALTLGTLIGCLWLLQAMTTQRKDTAAKKDTTGHVWDGDLAEFNNPLPRWWLWLFWITGIFMVVYLAIYPGLGTFTGLAGWSQQDQYDAEVADAEKRYGNIFAAFADTPVEQLATNPDAIRLGRNIFLNNCITCHGSDGGGARGYPNLTDKVWLHGGTPEAIKTTISNGRMGVMPALGAALGDQGVDEIIAFIRALPTLPEQPASVPATAYTPDTAAADVEPSSAAPVLDPKVAAGQQKFLTFCIACHGPDARGNQALGAPNLADEDWLHGSSDADIRDVIMKGRVNQMPAQADILTPDRIHVLAGYVLSLSADSGG